MEAYKNFKGLKWQERIDVNNFILENYTEYTGDESFLETATDGTRRLWEILSKMFAEEKRNGIYDAETRFPSQIDTYPAGYIDKYLEKIVGVQTDIPLKEGYSPTEDSVWYSKAWKNMATSWMKQQAKYILDIVKHITKVYSLHIQTVSAVPEATDY